MSETDPKGLCGFAGLAGLVTDINTVQAPIAAAARTRARSSSGPPSPRQPAAGVEPTTATPPNDGSPQAPPGSPPIKNVVLWLLLVGILAWVSWRIGSSNSDSLFGSTGTPEVSAPSTAASGPAPATAIAALGSPGTDAALPTPSTAAVRLDEEKPSVGQELYLSPAQIRYCLAEKIRVESAQPWVDIHREQDVALFNSQVDDYNQRCGSFRYMGSGLADARQALEPFQDELVAEGKKRFPRERLVDAVPAVDLVTDDRSSAGNPATELLPPTPNATSEEGAPAKDFRVPTAGAGDERSTIGAGKDPGRRASVFDADQMVEALTKRRAAAALSPPSSDRLPVANTTGEP